jgi:transcriptional regulator with XRE-family HTH domain
MLVTIRASDLFARLELEDPKFAQASEDIEESHILATNVLVLRARRNISQKELASRAGMSQPRIAEIESGEANPRLSTVKKIAKALGVTAGQLLTEDGVDEPEGITVDGGLISFGRQESVPIRFDVYNSLNAALGLNV